VFDIIDARYNHEFDVLRLLASKVSLFTILHMYPKFHPHKMEVMQELSV